MPCGCSCTTKRADSSSPLDGGVPPLCPACITMSDHTERTSLGIDANVAATLAYLLGWVSGAILLVTERQNAFVRFHALQSVIVFGTLSLAWFLLLSIPFIGWLISFILIPPLSAILWLLLMFKAYQGERFKIPVAGDIAAQRS